MRGAAGGLANCRGSLIEVARTLRRRGAGRSALRNPKIMQGALFRKRRAVVQASTRKPKIAFQLQLGRLPCQRRAIVQATAGTKLKLHLKKRCSRSDWTSASRPNVQQVVFHTCHASAMRTAPDQTASGQAVELRLDVPVHTKRRTRRGASMCAERMLAAMRAGRRRRSRMAQRRAPCPLQRRRRSGS